MRILIIAALLALLASPARSEPVLLNGSVSVSGNYVRMGDLFRNTGDKSDIIVAYAPVPGRQAVFDARWLYRVAQRYQLGWRPLTLQDRAVVRRDSQVITRDEIEEHVLEALRDRGERRDVKVFLSSRSIKLYVADDKPPTVAIEDLSYDRSTSRFSSLVVTPAGDPAAQRVRVTGRVIEMVEVPVATRRLLADSAIRESDIRWVKVRADHLQRDTISDAGDVIGKMTVRPLREGVPILASQVRRPVMAPKGSLVTMVLKGPAMLLTARGRAQEDGSLGDTIRVANTQSKQILEAVVTGPGTVSVRADNRLAMQ